MSIRPDDWNLPLFLHVLGALLVFGALVLAANYLIVARRDGSSTALRYGYRTLEYSVIPAYLLMRITAEWLAGKENVDDIDAAWVDIGYMVGDGGLLLIIVATVAARFAVRRAERGEEGGGLTLATVLVGVVIVATLIALWAMTTKPV